MAADLSAPKVPTMEMPVVASSDVDRDTLTEATRRSGSLRSSRRLSKMLEISLRELAVEAGGGVGDVDETLARPGLVTSSRFSTTILLFSSDELLNVGATIGALDGGLLV